MNPSYQAKQKSISRKRWGGRQYGRYPSRLVRNQSKACRAYSTRMQSMFGHRLGRWVSRGPLATNYCRDCGTWVRLYVDQAGTRVLLSGAVACAEVQRSREMPLLPEYYIERLKRRA